MIGSPFVVPGARVRLLLDSVAAFTARWTTPAPRLQRAAGHPMRYLWNAPARGRLPRAIVITIDGSDRDFRGMHAAFVRVRRDLPFDLATPFVVSNGPNPRRPDYPYAAPEFAAAIADPLEFDVSGIDATIHNVQLRNGRDLPVYLTGFSAGGHVAWLFTLEHSDRLAGVAMSSANFAMRGLSTRSGDTKSIPPIRGFFGESDSRIHALLEQWDSARALVERRD